MWNLLSNTAKFYNEFIVFNFWLIGYSTFGTLGITVHDLWGPAKQGPVREPWLNENYAIQGAEINKLCHGVFWVHLGIVPGTSCVTLWPRPVSSVKSVTTCPNVRTCDLPHKENATDSENFRSFRMRFDTFLDAISTWHHEFCSLHAISWTLERCTLPGPCCKESKYFHFQVRLCSGRLRGGHVIGNTDRVLRHDWRNVYMYFWVWGNCWGPKTSTSRILIWKMFFGVKW